MHETQRSVSEWADRTFGAVSSVASSLAVANEKAAFLIRELCEDASPAIVDEAATVLACLYRTASVVGIDLDEATDAVPVSFVSGKTKVQLASLACSSITFTIASTVETPTSCAKWGVFAQLAQAAACCRQIASMEGNDIEAALDRIMARWRRQHWTPDGTGHGTPVRVGEDIDKAAAGLATAVGLDWTLLDDAEAVGDEWEMGSARNVTRETFRNLARGAIEAAPASPLLSFTYTNWKGVTERRRVRLLGLRRGKTPWHPKEQFLLRAFCLDRGAEREFAVSDIHSMR